MAHIHTALGKIMSELQAIGKDSRNEQQGFKFRGIDAIVNALHPLFSKHGVIVLPNVIKAEHVKHEKNNKTIFSTYLDVEFHFTSCEDGSSVKATTHGESSDYADKSANKSASFAFKYALIQTFLLPTLDVDGDAENPTFENAPEDRNARPVRQERDRTMERLETNAPAGAYDPAPGQLDRPMEKVAPVQPKPWREYVCGTGSHPSFSIFTAGGRILGKAMGEIFDAEPAKYIAAFFTKMNEGFVIPSKKIPDGQLTDSDIDLLEALRDFKLAQAAKLVQIEKEKPAAHSEKPKTPREELKAIVIEAGATEEHFIEVAIKARWVPPGTSAISEIDDATVTSMLADIDTVRIAIKKA